MRGTYTGRDADGKATYAEVQLSGIPTHVPPRPESPLPRAVRRATELMQREGPVSRRKRKAAARAARGLIRRGLAR